MSCRTLVVALLAAIAIAGCSPDGPDARAVATTTPRSPEVAGDVAGEVASDLALAVDDTTHSAAAAAALDLRAERCGPRVGFGTASMIDADLAITAAHVIAGATEIEVTDIDGNRTTATPVLFDPDLDLALLRVADPIGTPIRLRAEAAMAGERGVVALPRWIGGELQLEVEVVTVVRTVNISTTDIYREGDVDRAGFEIDASIEPGNSGSLVVVPASSDTGTSPDAGDPAAAAGPFGVGIVWARSNRNDASAWAIDLPSEVLDPAYRATLTDPVHPGPCLPS